MPGTKRKREKKACRSLLSRLGRARSFQTQTSGTRKSCVTRENAKYSCFSSNLRPVSRVISSSNYIFPEPYTIFCLFSSNSQCFVIIPTFQRFPPSRAKGEKFREIPFPLIATRTRPVASSSTANYSVNKLSVEGGPGPDRNEGRERCGVKGAWKEA